MLRRMQRGEFFPQPLQRPHKQKRGPSGPRLRSVCAQALSDNLRGLQERHGGDRREQSKSGGEACKLGHLNFLHVFVAFEIEMPAPVRMDAAGAVIFSPG
jgi:hypothetical protein